MTYEQVIAYYLTQGKAAEAAGVRQSAVANWLRRGRIPYLSQLRLEAHSGGALKAVRDALTPRKGKLRLSHA